MAIKAELTIKGFKKLLNKLEDTRQAHSEIADVLESSTKLRFKDTEDPEGNQWLPLKYPRSRKRDKAAKSKRSKSGKSSSKDKPLNDSGNLKRSIKSNFDLESIRVGTNLEYAPPHQLGSEKKNIPARPFLGLSNEDRLDIIAILKKWILKKG